MCAKYSCAQQLSEPLQLPAVCRTNPTLSVCHGRPRLLGAVAPLQQHHCASRLFARGAPVDKVGRAWP
eukprot:1159413-Pelagomonas_calceolata.AAC.2